MAPTYMSPPGLRDQSRRTVENVKIKDTVRFDGHSCETKGEYTECTIALNPGGGNPLHSHDTFTESFFPISGKLGVQLGEESFHLEEGQSVSILRQQRHRFFNDSTETIRFRGRVAPGNPQFEKSICIAYGLVNDGLTDDQGIPQNFLHLCVMGVLGDVNLAGLAGLFLKPLMIIGAWHARWSGIEDELLAKYFS